MIKKFLISTVLFISFSEYQASWFERFTQYAARDTFADIHQSSIDTDSGHYARFALFTTGKASITKKLAIETPAQRYGIDESQTPEFAKFINKYGFPKELYKKLQTQEPTQPHNHPLNFSCFLKEDPHYIIKDDQMERVINAVRLRNFIEENHLTYVEVPQKYFGKLNNLWTVLAEVVPENREILSLSLAEIKELEIIALNTGFIDWHSGNILRNPQNNKLTFIDTEEDSFIDQSDEPISEKELLEEWLNNLKPHMSSEAATYLASRIENSNTQQKTFESKMATTLSNIDFKKSLREFQEKIMPTPAL